MSVPMPYKRMRGARPSPRHRLAAAHPHRTEPAPMQYACVPPQNAMFLNDQDGDCVTAEECVNINAYSCNTTGKCQIVSDAEINAWGGALGVLNGADLSQVMDALQKSQGNPLVAGGIGYYDGPPTAVNWMDRANLTSAIFSSQASVKISVDADVLENAAGNSDGWYLDSYSGTNQDHCVGLLGYGPASFCFQACGVPVPDGVDPASFCYLLDTWNTVGIVAATVIESAWVGEAWLRTPSSIPSVVPPVPPVPPPPPGPTPSPPTHRAIDLLARVRDVHAAGANLDPLFEFIEGWLNTKEAMLGTRQASRYSLHGAENAMSDASKSYRP